MYGPMWPFLITYGSHDVRITVFPQVDGGQRDPRVLGRHRSLFASVKVCFASANLRPLLACDSSFASARVLLHLGKGLHLDEGCLPLGELEAFNLFSFSFASTKLSLHLGEELRLGEAMPLVQVLLSCSFFPLICLLYSQSLQNSHE